MSHRKIAAATLGIVAIAALLGACAGSKIPKPDENFAATLPEEVAAPSNNNGSIYQAGYDSPLFENTIAHRIGDVITITLAEKTDATKSAITTTKKAQTASLSTPSILGGAVTLKGRNLLDTSLNNATTFDGEGGSSQSNELDGSITVTVVKRLVNGNLLVRGQKWITINQGREYLRIQGIVRPIDIAPDNSIPSYLVADATIAYGSEGTLNDANTKSWLARFFDSKWWPF